MCTVLVSYEPSNKMAVQTMNLLSMVRGVKIDNDAILTEDEVMRIVKAKKIRHLQRYRRFA